jgi:hypothetical protein
MSSLAEIVGNVANLFERFVKFQAKVIAGAVEEQTKVMECCFRRMCFWCGFLIFGMLLLLAGMGLIITGAFVLLASATGAGVAALIIGFIIALLSIILIVSVKNCKR